MYTSPTLELFLRVLRESDLFVHVDAVYGSASEEEGEIEGVTVVGGADSRASFPEMLKEAADSRRLNEGRSVSHK